MTKHSIENKAIIYTYSIIYEFSYKHYLMTLLQSQLVMFPKSIVVLKTLKIPTVAG